MRFHLCFLFQRRRSLNKALEKNHHLIGRFYFQQKEKYFYQHLNHRLLRMAVNNYLFLPPR